MCAERLHRESAWQMKVVLKSELFYIVERFINPLIFSENASHWNSNYNIRASWLLHCKWAVGSAHKMKDCTLWWFGGTKSCCISKVGDSSCNCPLSNTHTHNCVIDSQLYCVDNIKTSHNWKIVDGWITSVFTSAVVYTFFCKLLLLLQSLSIIRVNPNMLD